jgi:hypothetical protein
MAFEAAATIPLPLKRLADFLRLMYRVAPSKAAVDRGCPFIEIYFNSINSDNFSKNYDKFR